MGLTDYYTMYKLYNAPVVQMKSLKMLVNAWVLDFKKY